MKPMLVLSVTLLVWAVLFHSWVPLGVNVACLMIGVASEMAEDQVKSRRRRR